MRALNGAMSGTAVTSTQGQQMQQEPGKPKPAAGTAPAAGKPIQQGQLQRSCVQATKRTLAKHLKSRPAEPVATLKCLELSA